MRVAEAMRARWDALFAGEVDPLVYAALRIGVATLVLVRIADWTAPLLSLDHHGWVRGLDHAPSDDPAAAPALHMPLLGGLPSAHSTFAAALAWARAPLAVLVLLGLRAMKAHAHEPPTRPAGSALGVGLLHGAAGAHHLFAVLPGLLLEPTEAIVYLGGYLVAAVLAMAAAGAIVALGLRNRDSAARVRVHRLLGAGAVLTGVCWIGLSLG